VIPEYDPDYSLIHHNLLFEFSLFLAWKPNGKYLRTVNQYGLTWAKQRPDSRDRISE